MICYLTPLVQFSMIFSLLCLAATMSAIVAHPELHTNLVKEVKEEAPWLFASDARDQVIDYSFFMVSLCK